MVYGFNTHSFLNSPEHRAMKKERAATTKAFEATTRPEVEIRWSMCRCRSFRLAHSPDEHRKLRNEWDWRSWEDRQAGPEYFERWEK